MPSPSFVVRFPCQNVPLVKEARLASYFAFSSSNRIQSVVLQTTCCPDVSSRDTSCQSFSFFSIFLRPSQHIPSFFPIHIHLCICFAPLQCFVHTNNYSTTNTDCLIFSIGQTANKITPFPFPICLFLFVIARCWLPTRVPPISPIPSIHPFIINCQSVCVVCVCVPHRRCPIWRRR